CHCIVLSSTVSIIVNLVNPSRPTGIYPLSLHDALPISAASRRDVAIPTFLSDALTVHLAGSVRGERDAWLFPSTVKPGEPVSYSDRKSTRLNSSHVSISYAVFCLKKKTKNKIQTHL